MAHGEHRGPPVGEGALGLTITRSVLLRADRVLEYEAALRLKEETGGGVRHAKLRIHVRKVQERVRADHDHLQTGEGQRQVPEVQGDKGRATADALHGPNVEEELRGERGREGTDYIGADFEMNDQNLFDELLRAAENLGVAVRIEPSETPAIAGGGRCVFLGEPLVLIDARAPLRDRNHDPYSSDV